MFDVNPEQTRRPAIYTRVSSGEQVDNTSLDEQERRCRALALSRDHKDALVYREEGVTGTTADRPEWQRLLDDCRGGLVSTVYVLNWKRLARNARVGLEIAAQLEDLDVGLVVVEADFDTSTPTGKMMRHMMVGFAAFDRDSIVEQMARGQHAMAAQGLWPSGGASPFGYRASGGKGNTLVVHEEEAATVRLMVGWIVDERLTTGEVSRRLNAMGRFTRTGKEWTHSNLRRILRQRVLLGEVIWANTEKTHRSYLPTGKYGPPGPSQVRGDHLRGALRGAPSRARRARDRAEGRTPAVRSRRTAGEPLRGQLRRRLPGRPGAPTVPVPHEAVDGPDGTEVPAPPAHGRRGRGTGLVRSHRPPVGSCQADVPRPGLPRLEGGTGWRRAR